MKPVTLPSLSEIMENACEDMLLPRCETCETELSPGVATSTSDITGKVNQALLITSTPSHDWPALPEGRLPVEEAANSWVDCDVSSVASSWLDIGAAEEHADNEDEVVFVDAAGAAACTLQPVPAVPLWSAIVGRQAGTATVPHATGLLQPPLSRKRDVKARTETAAEEDQQDVDLDELEARRMLGRHRSGKK